MQQLQKNRRHFKNKNYFHAIKRGKGIPDYLSECRQAKWLVWHTVYGFSLQTRIFGQNNTRELAGH